MRRVLKLSLLAVFASAGLFLIFSAGASAAVSSASFGYNKANAAAPARKLYVSNCARCHGADGKSQTDAGRASDATDLTDAFAKSLSRKRVVNAIAHGADGMPAFGKKLSKAEIAMVAAYIRTL